jgi:acyl-CoA synthetase (AMP-forming)/AMP-acid ligase II
MSSIIELPTTECTSMVELLRMRALEQPHNLAYTFLADGEVEAASFTYGSLDRQARALAALFQKLNAGGERALMLYAPGVDSVAAFLGCLYAGVIAAPMVPPNPGRAGRTMPRLQAVVKDAGARFMLTTSSLFAEIEDAVEQFPDLKGMEWIATDEVDAALADDWRPPAIDPAAVAYLQYTSGSTSVPKGVMMTHANLMHICAYDAHLLDYRNEQGASVCWMPYFHDYGLVDGLMFPLYNGIPSYLMSPLAFVQQPIRWLQAISRYRASNSAAPNFAYDLCVRKTTPEQRATLDLSCWRSTSNAAEPIHKKTMERFVEAFAPCGFSWDAFYPGYGLAEATLIISARRRPVFYPLKADALEQKRVVEAAPDDAGVRTLVGCGLVAEDMCATRVVIADPQTLETCAPDRIGEIWISGELVAQGYWQRPEETARTFQAYLADTGEGPFLRTGDLGFIKDGEVVMTGRLKDLIIIEGRNHYPQDIEKTTEESYPALRPGCSAAFSISPDGEERLVVVVEVNRGYYPAPAGDEARPDGATPAGQPLDPKRVRKLIRQAVAEEHDIHVHEVVLLSIGTIHKTSSGKIQRNDCRNGYLSGTLDVWPGQDIGTPSAG